MGTYQTHIYFDAGRTTMEIDSSGAVDCAGTITIESGGDLNVDSGGTITVDSGGKVEITGAGSIEDGGTFTIESGGTLTLDSGGTLALTGIPTSDPGVDGQVWANSNVLTVSAGN